VFANAGIRNPYTAILKIENSKGEVLEKFVGKPEQALNEESANKISDILSDNTARTPAYGSNSPLYIKDRPVAVKTGTTNDYRDVWIVGYTPNLVVGAWMGNNDNSPMVKKTAGLIISPMWRSFMDVALPTLPKEYFGTPEPTPKDIKPVFRGVWQGYDSFVIDKISGKLATELTPEETRQEMYIPNVHEILYWVDKKAPWGPVPTNPADDPQFNLWEYSVQKWVQTQNLTQPNKPSDYDDVHTKRKAPNLTIINPNQNNSYRTNEKIIVQTTNSGSYTLTKLDFYINNIYIGSSSQSPFLFSFTPSEISNISRRNTLKVIATDAVYNRSEEEINFEVSI
jgi:membrane peptidoglycan carboxypeptidase